MDVVRQQVGSLFEQTIQLTAPLFQRPYVWRRTQNWEPLWETIANAAARRRDKGNPVTHFLGAIVLEQEVTTTLGLGNVRRIIDGQQRLTTFQVLFRVIRNLARERDLKFEAEDIGRLTANHTRELKDQAKVVPTTADREVFSAVMRSDSKNEVASLKTKSDETRPRVADAYLFFHDAVEEFLADGTPSDIQHVIKAVQNDLEVVVINLDGTTDDAQEIFETLNARGEPLLPSDLIKNYLFHRAELDGVTETELQALYEEHWIEFDRDASYWRELVRQGPLTTPRVNIFLQYYLTLLRREEMLAGNIFVEFKKYASEKTVRSMLSSLEDYSVIFRSLSHFPANSREAEFFRRLAELDVTTFHPLLLQVFHERAGLGEAGVSAILTDIESYLVRRSVCRLSTRGYNRTVVELLASIGEDLTPEKVRGFLAAQTSDNNIWPNDADFRQAWVSEPLYKGRRSRVRMILEALEARARTPKVEDVTFNQKLSVEHLMPQNWKRLWPLPAGVPELQADRRRSQLLHSIGNLTLLTHELNASVSDADWKSRLPEILRYSKLLINEELRTVTEWSEERIEERALRLFELAKVIWPHPNPTGASLGAGARRDPIPAADDAEIAPYRQRDELLQVMADKLGDNVATEFKDLINRLEGVDGIKVKVNKTFRCRLSLKDHPQRLSLFVAETNGELWFAWMKKSQLPKIGLSPGLADTFYQDLAEAYGVDLRKGEPDGLSVEMLVADKDALIGAVERFVGSVRAATSGTGSAPDEAPVGG